MTPAAAFLTAVSLALLLGVALGRYCGLCESLERFRVRTAPRRKWVRRHHHPKRGA